MCLKECYIVNVKKIKAENLREIISTREDLICDVHFSFRLISMKTFKWNIFSSRL